MRSNTSLSYQLVSKMLSNFACIAHSYHLISCFSRFKGNVYCLNTSRHNIDFYFLHHTHTHTQLIPNILIQNQMNCVRALAVGLRINTDYSMQQSMVSPMWKLCINVWELNNRIWICNILCILNVNYIL